MRNAFDNTNLLSGVCNSCDCTGFVPNVTFTYDANAKTITVTDASTYPNGDDRKIVNLRVCDKNWKTVDGNIASDDGDDAVTLDVSSLDLSEGFILNGTVVTNAGCISDGHWGRLGMISTSGTLANWDKDNNSLVISNVDEDDES